MGATLTVIGIFTALQVINVVLNTAKTLIMARTDNPHTSALINAVTFGFYTVVVKQIATLDLLMTTIVVIVTNVIGVYLTYWIANRLKKDSLWKIEIYCKNLDGVKSHLYGFQIPYAEITPEIITVYAYTQADSRTVKQIIETTPFEIKYNITEVTKKF